MIRSAWTSGDDQSVQPATQTAADQSDETINCSNHSRLHDHTHSTKQLTLTQIRMRGGTTWDRDWKATIRARMSSSAVFHSTLISTSSTSSMTSLAVQTHQLELAHADDVLTFMSQLHERALVRARSLSQ